MKDFIVKRTDRGKGVFSGRNFKKGETLVRFHGKIFRGSSNPPGFASDNNHYLQVGDDLYIAPSRTADNYVNHSCNPNSWVKIDGKRAALVSLRDISKGEEITFDYSTTMYKDSWEMKCICGSRGCRKIVKEFRLLPASVKRKYIKMGIIPDYVLNGIKAKVF